MNRFTDLTDYPALYEHSHWGRLGLVWLSTAQRQCPDPGIVDNRNTFVTKYGLSRPTDPPQDVDDKAFGKSAAWSHILDRVEHYKCALGWIVLTSPADDSLDEARGRWVEQSAVPQATVDGWTKIPQMYDASCTTYACLITPTSDQRQPLPEQLNGESELERATTLITALQLCVAARDATIEELQIKLAQYDQTIETQKSMLLRFTIPM